MSQSQRNEEHRRSKSFSWFTTKRLLYISTASVQQVKEPTSQLMQHAASKHKELRPFIRWHFNASFPRRLLAVIYRRVPSESRGLRAELPLAALFFSPCGFNWNTLLTQLSAAVKFNSFKLQGLIEASNENSENHHH